MNKGKNTAYSMMKCVKCGFEHKETDVYKKCSKCNCKQFHIVRRMNKEAEMKFSLSNLKSSNKGSFTMLLWIIFLMVMITYIIIRICKLLGWL